MRKWFTVIKSARCPNHVKLLKVEAYEKGVTVIPSKDLSVKIRLMVAVLAVLALVLRVIGRE